MSDLRPAIADKREGRTLTPEQVAAFVRGAADGVVSEVQLAAMLMAVLLQGMTAEERACYVREMVQSGDVLDMGGLTAPVVDKHSTGGVGDKVSLPLAPLLAAAGMAVPMISGRGLGHTGGTLDKLEAIPGFRTDLEPGEIRAQVEAIGCVITGQTAALCPADRVLYDLRSRTATVESVDHIVASIMSKKLAEGIGSLVLDVKVGSGAFMKGLEEARILARALVDTGLAAGCRTRALITRMDRPLGRFIGNGLEVQESLLVLSGGGPADTRELTVALAAELMVATGRTADIEGARQRAGELLDGGEAMAVFREMVARQGGDLTALDATERLLGSTPPFVEEVRAPSAGWIGGLDALQVGLAAARLGAARGADGSAPDPGVGVELCATVGDAVEADAVLARLYHRETGVSEARQLLLGGLSMADEAPTATSLVLERVE